MAGVTGIGMPIVCYPNLKLCVCAGVGDGVRRCMCLYEKGLERGRNGETKCVCVCVCVSERESR